MFLSSHRSGASAILTAVSVVLSIIGCGDSDGVRVRPNDGYQVETVVYDQPASPVAIDVPVPVAVFDSEGERPPEPVGELERQRADFPIHFHGRVDGLSGGLVIVLFLDAEKLKSGVRVQTNSLTGTVTPIEGENASEYSASGRTPRSTGPMVFEIVVSSVEFPKQEGERAVVHTRVIATGTVEIE